jgi:hypothetical protein
MTPDQLNAEVDAALASLEEVGNLIWAMHQDNIDLRGQVAALEAFLRPNPEVPVADVPVRVVTSIETLDDPE